MNVTQAIALTTSEEYEKVAHQYHAYHKKHIAQMNVTRTLTDEKDEEVAHENHIKSNPNERHKITYR
jgi:hypothetical protein